MNPVDDSAFHNHTDRTPDLEDLIAYFRESGVKIQTFLISRFRASLPYESVGELDKLYEEIYNMVRTSKMSPHYQNKLMDEAITPAYEAMHKRFMKKPEKENTKDKKKKKHKRKHKQEA